MVRSRLFPQSRSRTRLVQFEKTNRVFSQNNARYFLEVADSKLEEIDRLIAGLNLQANKENILGVLRGAIESGFMSPNDLVDALSKIDGFQLSTGIEFVDGSWNGSDNSAKIEDLLDRRVLLGGTTNIDGVEFVNDTGGSMTVRTCREYRAAKAAGYYALTTFAMKMEAFLGAANAVLEVVSCAQIPVVSYVRSPHKGVADLNLFPAEILPTLSPDGEAEIRALGDVTLQELVLSGKVSIIDVSSTRLTAAFDGVGMSIRELLRADFNGDGIEEILVQYYVFAIGGTLGLSSIGVLNRSGPVELFKYESWPPR